jgi:ABC-2 type transport system permease protein
MGVELLHYRPWRGTFAGPTASVWPIARVALWMMFRRKVFWGLYALGLMMFLLFFFGQYLLAWAEAQASGGRMGNTPWLIKLLRDNLKLNGVPTMYANFFWYQGYTVMVLLALAGSGLIGNDFHFGSLPFYLSKPLSRWHYLLGKCLSVGIFVNLLTTLPAVILFVQYGLLYSWDYFWNESWLLAGILGYGLFLSVCLSLILGATASALQRTVPMVMVWTILFLFTRLLGSVLVDLLHHDANWRLLDLWNDTFLVGNFFLGIDVHMIRPAAQPSYLAASLVLGALSVICLTYWILRIRAVDIVR